MALVERDEEQDVVDLAYPGEASVEFAYEILDHVAQKGYCTVLMPQLSHEERQGVVTDAQRLPRHYRMKQEIETGYMGYDSSTKLSIRKHDSPAKELKDVMSRCDRCLTHVALSLNEVPQESLGFVCKSRTNAFVRTSYKDEFEESIILPESLTMLEDPEKWTSDVVSFLNFVQSRTLSMLYMIENSGGYVWLYPKDAKNSRSVQIPVVPNKMLIFRHDWADYSYQPIGASVALQAWIMKDRRDLAHIRDVSLNLDRSVAVVNPGHAEPQGPPVHVQDLHVRFPAVEGKTAWWNNFVGGTDGVTKWPLSRWDTDAYYMPGDEAPAYGKSYTCHGGFTNDNQLLDFDNKFFGISEKDAKEMIISQRWIAEVGYQCLNQAGYDKHTMAGESIGTWIGDVGPDWHGFTTEWARFFPTGTPDFDPGKFRTSLHVHCAAARLSYMFDLRGPVASFDTACSASLVAMNACHTLMFASDPPKEEHSKGLVLGVNTLLGPGSFIGNCAGGMLSHIGRSFTFNRSADGYQRGEGCGAVFLNTKMTEERKQLSYASIIGTATNQDGRSASITAPNGPAQTSVITKSMKFAGIDVNLVGMAECHGTGTALGDPIEIGALQVVMKKREFPIIKVSTKSHIGHLEAAAGIAGLTKCIMMIRAATGTPNCHFNIINPHLVTDGYPVFFNTEISDTGYASGYCGVSSFGFGGTNSRCDVYAEATLGARRKVHIPLPPPSFPRHIFNAEDEIKVVGTCGAWAMTEAMVPSEEHGILTHLLTLGETRVESFRLMLGYDEDRLIYPGSHKADASAQVLGPDSLCHNRFWTIDGREDGMPAGTVYQVTFRWAGGVKRVSWMPVAASKEALKENIDHQYFCIGTFNQWSLQQMKSTAGTTNTVELTFPIGPRQVEEFQFVRDRDMQQVFYPEEGGEVCGPSEADHADNNRKSFQVRGQQFDLVTVRFTLKDGIFTVRAKTDRGTATTWGAASTFAITDAQKYYVIGSYDNWVEFQPMTSVAGVLKANITLGNFGQEEFQIVLNRDLLKRLSPSQKGAVLGPSADAKASWMITGQPGSSWEIVFDLNASDKCNMVSYSMLESSLSALTDY